MAHSSIVYPMTDRVLTTILRIETPSDGGDLHTLRQLAIDAGFDGVEVAIDQAPALPKVEAVFASCSVSPLDEAHDIITTLLESAAAFGACCMNLTLTPMHAKNENQKPSMHRDMTSI